MDNMNRGLEGLGVINTNNSSATIDQMGGSFSSAPVATDERLFDNNLSRYSSNVDFHNYVTHFLMNSGVANVQQLTDADRQQLGLDNAFVVQMPASNAIFTMFTCLNYNDVLALIDKIGTVVNNNIPPRKVAIGLYNYDNNMVSNANKVGLELLGYNEILDINSAITSANNRMPYMNMKNNFEALLAKQLYEKYKQTATGSFGNQLSGQAAGIGASLGSAFSEGFGQLKQSLFSLGKDLGIIKDNNNQAMGQPNGNTYGMNQNNGQPVQQPINNYGGSQTNINETTGNRDLTNSINGDIQTKMGGISLGKSDNPNVNLEMETKEPLNVQVRHEVAREINETIVNNTKTSQIGGVSLSKK